SSSVQGAALARGLSGLPTFGCCNFQPWTSPRTAPEMPSIASAGGAKAPDRWSAAPGPNPRALKDRAAAHKRQAPRRARPAASEPCAHRSQHWPSAAEELSDGFSDFAKVGRHLL